MPIPGAPLSVQEIETRETVRPDGTVSTERSETAVWRDEDGRLRIEQEIKAPGRPPLIVVEIADPGAGFVAILDAHGKVAHRLQAPADVTPAPRSSGPDAGPRPSPRPERPAIESLGTQVIEGVEFKGTRATIPPGTPSALFVTLETWTSAELKLTGLSKSSNPDGGATTRTIRNLKPGPQDPGLFLIPPDYQIEDLEPPQ